MPAVTKETLRAFLHDSLPDAEAAEVERQLRDDPRLRAAFEQVRLEEDRGEHSVGAIWRRDHVSCPSRDQLGGYLLQALDQELIDYLEFHLTVVGCSFCSANLDDLKQKQAEAAAATKTRRKKIVNSSAGVLRDATRPA
jgi:hypothetical protein